MGSGLVAYIDVDDTFVRSFGSKRIPMSSVLDHIHRLHGQGLTLYCWSSGGADYARASAREFGVEHCFTAFLPKPNVLIDDQCPQDWRGLVCVHPNEAVSMGAIEFAAAVATGMSSRT